MTGRARLDRARRLLDTPPPSPVPGQLPLDRPQPTCDAGNPRCHAVPARPYPCGWRCEAHRPVPRPS
ncbi:aromatic ring-opening dioxygenase LigA [Streptomyces sp. WAC01280]|uniref:aromatic ring-opening dioxygenase LigA n=1 Tax=Streptomyces sp. WAC01280 TaxID=2487424 RepID=UPI000F767A6E|nr:aromatic ring-opening dioxygenase LigA [Streptomyces sp. WAC01280]RSS59551.1 aromatic ring-opening dioxygenase LigA [Streptomyces sp. WAC01280]